jgi:hypothetical protein
VRHDEPAGFSGFSLSAESRRPVRSRLRASIWPAATAVLVAITSLVVGVYASAWLVPPYLVLMALVLGVPIPGRRGQPRRPDKDKARRKARALNDGDTSGLGSFASTEGVDSEIDSGSDPRASSDAATDQEAASGSELAGLKNRRGKGRVRKSKPAAAALVEPASATWIRIGPGKFVRADTAGVVEAEEPGGLAAGSPFFVPAGVPETALTWSTTWMDAPAPAIEPGTGDMDGDARGWGGGLSLGLGVVVAAGLAPDVTGRETSGDNGIAPDALGGLSSCVADDGRSHTLDLEAASTLDLGPEPSCSSDVPEFEPPVACASTSASEPATEPSPAPAPVVEGGLRRDSPVGRPSRQPFQALAVSSRAAGANRSALSVGNVHRGRPARVLGSCPHPRRVRNAGRFQQADRTHPPRSPPSRAVVSDRQRQGASSGDRTGRRPFGVWA